MNYTNQDHIIIIGWNKKSESAINELLKSNQKVEVVLIDTLERSPVDVSNERVHYIQGSPTEKETLYKANINKAKSVIVFSDDTIPDSSLRDAKTLNVAIVV
ncbi:NAD-binding protein [Ornithinibacillus halophilus]|uniref:Voltage-gated potassium channel n=1 Tax=Ornithinibacillus halophilus TaxID=930117 RepID=A0A1M5IHV6_9BACI|nr:NAD-binding protein [Ornithinibacillus halophilus]SHG27845.1 voltage-gated potassium channel [Ornithinibacillus halophilus]